MKISRKISIILLCAAIIFCISPISAFAKTTDCVKADWHFDESGIESGGIDSDDLVIADQSGNGNSLVLEGNNAKKYIEFSNDKMYGKTSGSLVFNNEKKRILGKGVEFVTKKDAEINKSTFDNGYTIELIYKLPEDFSADDAWMGLISRKGKSETMTETKKCSMSLAVSNCKELQFMTANKNDSHKMEEAAWSVTMDKGGVWYHIAIVSDGKTISTFVNGCEAFRDYASEEMVGMMADSGDGRFVVGGYNNGVLNHYGRGAVQQIRISDRPLTKSQWLINDLENYVEKYGENRDFANLSKSSYNIVFLPDIQNAVEFCPDVLYTAAEWLNKNREKINASAMISLGDSINDYDDAVQWENARKFYKKLETGNYPILQQPGNHDYGEEYYLDSFGPGSDFGVRQTKRGVTYSPSGYSSYMFFDGGSYKYMAVSISMAHIEDKEECKWLDNVLFENKNYPTVVTSHSFQDCDAAKPNDVVLNDFGKGVWEIVKKHNQVFLMISGHNHGAGEEVLLNDSKNEVYSIMADYQFTFNGGNAFFKFAEFDEAHNKIRLSTFSPYAVTLNDNERTFFDVNYMTGDGNYTVIDFDFENRFKGLEKSDNEKQFKTVLKKAKNEETDTPNALFDNVKTISRADAHSVEKSSKINAKTIVFLIFVAVIFLITTNVTIFLVTKKSLKKLKEKRESNNQ